MNSLTVATLFAAGIAGGIINALAGGATLITFPAMLSAGLAPVVANASNALAIAPGHLLAAIADCHKLPAFGSRLAMSLIVCIVGGLGGALILLALPDRLFVLPVPALIAFATILFALSPKIARWADRRRDGRDPSARAEIATLAAASVYGGFFGAGLGVILTAVLALGEPEDIRKVKVLKNLLATAVSLAAISIFVTRGMIAWQPTLVMLCGALIGGYAGGYLVKVLPGVIVRWFVLVAGTFMTFFYAWRFWF
jgi:uncharacterized membrane protein YfcA